MATDEERFGSGIALDRQWDLVLDGTGDLAATFGVNELEKDIAFNVATRVTEEIGSKKDESAYSSIKAVVVDVLSADSRVRRVQSVSVNDGGVDTASVEATVLTESDEAELVFEV